MKKFFTFLLVFCSVVFISAQTFEIPEIPGKSKQTSVFDYIGLLSTSQKSNLEQKLIRYADSTSTQIVVAIIPSTNGEYIGTLTSRWAHKWGIGQEKEDNGVFILLAKNDRKIWIAPGYGVEHKLTAGLTGDITRTIIIPEFKKGDYSSGLNKGVDEIIKVLHGTYKASPKNNNSFPFLPLLVIIVVIILIIVFSKNKNNRGGGGGRLSSGDIFSTIILSGMGRSGGSGFGSSGGSFGGGGFGGGFGGGGFSGGGAGGSW